MDVDEPNAKPHVSALPASSADFQYTCHIVRPHRRQEARASRAPEVADRLIKGVLTSILSLDRVLSREQLRAKLPSILPDVAARAVTGPLGALVVEHEANTLWEIPTCCSFITTTHYTARTSIVTSITKHLRCQNPRCKDKGAERYSIELAYQFPSRCIPTQQNNATPNKW